MEEVLKNESQEIKRPWQLDILMFISSLVGFVILTSVFFYEKFFNLADPFLRNLTGDLFSSLGGYVLYLTLFMPFGVFFVILVVFFIDNFSIFWSLITFSISISIYYLVFKNFLKGNLFSRILLYSFLFHAIISFLVIFSILFESIFIKTEIIPAISSVISTEIKEYSLFSDVFISILLFLFSSFIIYLSIYNLKHPFYNQKKIK